MKRIQEMEQLQAQREMMLEAREAIDMQQLEEMNLARSLALDSREKMLQQKEKEQKESLAQMFNRSAQSSYTKVQAEGPQKLYLHLLL